MISFMSLYPVICFLNKQKGFKIGRRMFDQIMIYSIMILIVAHFVSEQKFLAAYSFIPLSSWHKLINIVLLIEQCSLVLFLGTLSGTLNGDIEATLFGINLLLILIMQERDSVNGEIKWSVIPLIINNSYMLFTNLNHYFNNI